MSILDIAREAASLSRSTVTQFGLDYRSVGTKQLALGIGLSEEDGFWEDPSSISAKPPRWILQLVNASSDPQVRLAGDADGTFPTAGTPGYINNGQGKCALVAVRVVIAVEITPGHYEFPRGWEWLVQLAFPTALPNGTSSDTLTDFSLERGTVRYKGRTAQKREYAISRIFVFPTSEDDMDPVRDVNGTVLTYRQVTRALTGFFSAGPVPALTLRLSDPDDRDRLVAELLSLYGGKSDVDLDEAIYESLASRLNAGERGFLSELAPSVYRVAPPLATRGTRSSSIPRGAGDEIE